MAELATKIPYLSDEFIADLATLHAPKNQRQAEERLGLWMSLPFELDESDFNDLSSRVGEFLVPRRVSPTDEAELSITRVLPAQVRMTRWLGGQALIDSDTITYDSAQAHLRYLEPRAPFRTRLAGLALWYEKRNPFKALYKH